MLPQAQSQAVIVAVTGYDTKRIYRIAVGGHNFYGVHDQGPVGGILSIAELLHGPYGIALEQLFPSTHMELGPITVHPSQYNLARAIDFSQDGPQKPRCDILAIY